MFDAIRERIDLALEQAVRQMGDDCLLRDACSYALLSEGKRLRPILVLLIAKNLGRRDPLKAALSVEYFHTASLIADDLPCMDNDDERRGRKALHKAFGEGTAVLASYALIAAGYGGIYEEALSWKKENPELCNSIDAVAMECLSQATRVAGLKGAAHGQFLDLFPPDSRLETIELIVERKTSSLFEISYVFGWLFGGGSVLRIQEVIECARVFGKAFQLADDSHDMRQDMIQKRVSLALVWGKEKSFEVFEKLLEEFALRSKNLGLWTQEFQEICGALRKNAAVHS